MSSNIDCLWGHVPLSRRNMGHSTVDYNEAGGKAKKLTFSKRGGKKGRSSLFLTELIIFSEGVGGFKKQQRQQQQQRALERSWRWNIQRGLRPVTWWALYCWDPFLNHSSRTVISPPFPGYKTPSIWHLWQRASFCSSTGRRQGWAPRSENVLTPRFLEQLALQS